MAWPGGRKEREHAARKIDIAQLTMGSESHEGGLCERSLGLAGFNPRDSDGEGEVVEAHGPPVRAELEWTFATERRRQQRPGARLGAQKLLRRQIRESAAS